MTWTLSCDICQSHTTRLACSIVSDMFVDFCSESRSHWNLFMTHTNKLTSVEDTLWGTLYKTQSVPCQSRTPSVAPHAIYMHQCHHTHHTLQLPKVPQRSLLLRQLIQMLIRLIKI